MNPSILAVDDTPANLTLLSGILKEGGYRIRPVPSGELALAAAEADPPDLILLDIAMPEMDGYEVCARLKASPRLREIPVIFLTAHTDVRDKVKAFSVGGVDYVTKPFHAEEVIARVSAHLMLRAQQRELQASYDRLAELERTRDGLVHMLVHDLRSPLSAILGMLEMIRDEGESLPEQTREDADHGLQAARRMIEMVTDILDVSKLEAAAMQLDAERCDLAVVAREVIAEIRPIATARGLATIAVEPGVETSVAVDRALLVRVIRNLLTNAIQFTPRGGGVSVVVEPHEASVRVSITDDGPGVPENVRARIFEKFGTVGPRNGRYSTGLGLAFCRLAVEAHGGTIGVVGRGDRAGSTFWFAVPSS